MGNMIQQHQEMDRSKQQQCLDVPLCCRGLSSAYAHSAASAQCRPQVGSAVGSSLLSPLARAAPTRNSLDECRCQRSAQSWIQQCCHETVPWQWILPYSTSRLNLPDAHVHIWAHSKSPRVTHQDSVFPHLYPLRALCKDSLLQFHFGQCPGLGESSAEWFCAGRSPQLSSLPWEPATGLFPRQEPCLRGSLSPGKLQYWGKLYREKHIGNEGMGQYKRNDHVHTESS